VKNTKELSMLILLILMVLRQSINMLLCWWILFMLMRIKEIMSRKNSLRLNSPLMRLFLVTLFDSKLGRFKLRILVYLKIISLSQFSTKLRMGQKQEHILRPKKK
jgi:hypothetical protein